MKFKIFNSEHKITRKKSLEVHLKLPAIAFRPTVYHNMDNGKQKLTNSKSIQRQSQIKRVLNHAQ